MTETKFINNYQQFLRENSEPKRAAKEKAYLYSDLKHYGVTTAQRRKWISEHRKYIKGLEKPQMLNLVATFWGKPSFEERSLSLAILNNHLEVLDTSDMPMIEKMMRESRGWAFLDGLIIPVMPVLLEKDPEVYEVLKSWIKDDDFWVRRSALLSQLLFFRHDNGGDRELFFSMAKSQFDEAWIDDLYESGEPRKRARFFIRKAIGWTLREMSAKQPKVVFEFVKKYRDDMSGLSFREGSRKLPDEYKEKLGVA